MSNNLISTVCQSLLAPAGLDKYAIAQTMDHLLHKKINIADIYCHHLHLETWSLEDGIIKEGNNHIKQGIGIRAISGEKTGFSCTNEFSLSSLIEAAKTARNIAVRGQKSRPHKITQQSIPTH